jgi:hypothetical protein
MIVSIPIRTRNPLNGQTGNSRQAAAIRAKARAEQRRIAQLLTRTAIWRHGHPSLPLRITLTRLSSERMDDDNLAATLKGIRDGVADALQVDDGSPELHWHYEQRIALRGMFGVEVEFG